MLTRRLWPRWLMTAVAPNCRSIFAMELATRIRASHRNSSATCFVPLPRAPSSTDTFEAVFLVPNWLLKTKGHWACNQDWLLHNLLLLSPRVIAHLIIGRRLKQRMRGLCTADIGQLSHGI